MAHDCFDLVFTVCKNICEHATKNGYPIFNKDFSRNVIKYLNMYLMEYLNDDDLEEFNDLENPDDYEGEPEDINEDKSVKKESIVKILD